MGDTLTSSLSIARMQYLLVLTTLLAVTAAMRRKAVCDDGSRPSCADGQRPSKPATGGPPQCSDGAYPSCADGTTASDVFPPCPATADWKPSCGDGSRPTCA